MKILTFIFTVLSLVAVFVGRTQVAQAQTSISFGVFYESLRPYGEWLEVPDYGMCWRPTVVEVGWRPYTHGHWVWTEYGWTWVSDYVWGWAPFHYGRWVYDDYYGWIWVPDYVWGPAWVQWRISAAYIGWAPLPPRARWGFSLGVAFDDYGISHFGWNFCYASGFVAERLVVLPVHYNVTIIRRTRNITIVNNRIYNHGPRVDWVERTAKARVPRFNVVESRDFGSVRGNRLEGNRLYLYKPEIRKDTEIGRATDRVLERHRFEGERERRNESGNIQRDGHRMEHRGAPQYFEREWNRHQQGRTNRAEHERSQEHRGQTFERRDEGSRSREGTPRGNR